MPLQCTVMDAAFMRGTSGQRDHFQLHPFVKDHRPALLAKNILNMDKMCGGTTNRWQVVHDRSNGLHIQPACDIAIVVYMPLC